MLLYFISIPTQMREYKVFSGYRIPFADFRAIFWLQNSLLHNCWANFSLGHWLGDLMDFQLFSLPVDHWLNYFLLHFNDLFGYGNTEYDWIGMEWSGVENNERDERGWIILNILLPFGGLQGPFQQKIRYPVLLQSK